MIFLKKIDNRIILICILAIQLLFALFYCNMKKGYFVDELWSYGLSNSYYHAQLWEDGGFDETEVNPESFTDYLVVNQGEEFTYGSVIYNQTHDAHPPLFYIVLHTVSSFFPGEFSKWFGLVPNIFYYLLSMIFIYKISKLFSKNRYFAFMPILLYGFSVAAVNTVTYIRMYMLMTLWGLIFAYFHVLTMIKKQIRIRDLVMLSISTFGGMFTHYFFVIFACPWVLTYLIWLIREKRWKNLTQYCVSGIIGASVVFAFYPNYIRFILGQQKGVSQNTFSNLTNLQEIVPKIREYVCITSTELFGGIFGIIIILLIASIIGYVITRILWHVQVKSENHQLRVDVDFVANKNHYEWKVRTKHIVIVIMVISIVFYYAIVSNIAPFFIDRYVMIEFPFIVITFCAFLYWVFGLWKISLTKKIISMICCIVLIGGMTYYSTDPQYLYDNKKNNETISKEYGEYPCAYIFSDGRQWFIVNSILELQHYNMVYQLSYTDLDDKLEKISMKNDGLVIYLDSDLEGKNNMSMQDYVERIMDGKSLNSQKLLFQDGVVDAYFLYNE